MSAIVFQVFMKSVKLEWCLGDIVKARELLNESVKHYPHFAKVSLVHWLYLLQCCIRGPPNDWRCRTSRPRQTWLRMVKDDLLPLDFGLAMARRRAWDRSA